MAKNMNQYWSIKSTACRDDLQGARTGTDYSRLSIIGTFKKNLKNWRYRQLEPVFEGKMTVDSR